MGIMIEHSSSKRRGMTKSSYHGPSSGYFTYHCYIRYKELLDYQNKERGKTEERHNRSLIYRDLGKNLNNNNNNHYHKFIAILEKYYYSYI